MLLIKKKTSLPLNNKKMLEERTLTKLSNNE